MAPETIKADKEYRKKVLIVILLIAALGITALFVLIPAIAGYFRRIGPDRSLPLIKTILITIFLSVIPFGLYFFYFGRKVVKHRRFPPPGAKVIRDTRLLEGSQAVTRGYVILFLSVIILVLSLMFAWRAHLLFERLMDG